MRKNKLLVTTVLSASLLIAGGGGARAADSATTDADCVGQHVSEMAGEMGGMAAATAYHNEMHGTDLTVGEHQAHVRSEMCGR